MELLVYFLNRILTNKGIFIRLKELASIIVENMKIAQGGVCWGKPTAHPILSYHTIILSINQNKCHTLVTPPMLSQGAP